MYLSTNKLKIYDYFFLIVVAATPLLETNNEFFAFAVDKEKDLPMSSISL